MCFSAEASFATCAALIPAGGYCIRAAWRSRRTELAIAVIPAVFAVQQACEGVTWIGLERNDHDLARGAAIVFLFFAIAFWPAWIPLALGIAQPRIGLRRVLFGISVVAIASGLFVWAPLAAGGNTVLSIDVAGHSLRYEFESALAFDWLPRLAWQAAYVVAVSLPFLIMESRALRYFGIAVTISAIATHVAFAVAFISIWCAFAAVLSLWLCLYFRRSLRNF